MHGIQKYNILQEGLFLSPDPVLQDPANALPACRNASTGRNYNRYSYVLPVPKSEATSGNNPLKYTDPSGYLFYYKGAWISDYKDWVSNPFGNDGSFESPGSGGGSRRGDSRLDAYSDFVKSLGSSIDWREFYAQFGYRAKEIWQIGPNKIGVHYIDGKMEQLDFTSVVSWSTGVPPTGDKFYSTDGVLLWDTHIIGQKNRVLVFEPKGRNQNFEGVVKAYSNPKDPRGLLMRMRQLSTEYNYFNPDLNSDYLFVIQETSGWSKLLEAIHFASEGGILGALGAKSGNEGLERHYNMIFTARSSWLDTHSVKVFQPWW